MRLSAMRSTRCDGNPVDWLSAPCLRLLHALLQSRRIVADVAGLRKTRIVSALKRRSSRTYRCQARNGLLRGPVAAARAIGIITATTAAPTEMLCSQGSGRRCGAANDLAAKAMPSMHPADSVATRRYLLAAVWPTRRLAARGNPSTAVVWIVRRGCRSLGDGGGRRTLFICQRCRFLCRLRAVAIVAKCGTRRAGFCHALPVPHDFSDTALQGTDTVDFAAKDNQQIIIGVRRHRRQLGVFRQLVERGLHLRAGPLVVDGARIAADAVQFVLDRYDQAAGRERVGWLHRHSCGRGGRVRWRRQHRDLSWWPFVAMTCGISVWLCGGIRLVRISLLPQPLPLRL